jgi:hypothetical protein
LIAQLLETAEQDILGGSHGATENRGYLADGHALEVPEYHRLLLAFVKPLDRIVE